MVCTRESEPHKASGSQFLSVISHFGERDGVTRLKTPASLPKGGACRAIFWGLVSSQKVLMELCFGICTCRPPLFGRRRECRGGVGWVRLGWGVGWGASLSVKPLKGDTASTERMAASVLLSSSRRHTQDANSHRQLLSPRCSPRAPTPEIGPGVG